MISNPELTKEFLQAKNTLIESCFSALNDCQRQCVLSPDDAMLILAGAGSGKTTVLINRITNLIAFGRGYTAGAEDYGHITDDQAAEVIAMAKGERSADFNRLTRLLAVGPVEPWRVLVITFTNKAASELKDRIARKLGSEENQIWASTFHSACARILRADCEVLGYQKDFTIYDADDSKKMLKDILADLQISDKECTPKQAYEEIGRAKDKLYNAETYAEKCDDARFECIAAVYKEYEKRLMLANAMDFDDLIFRTVELFEQFPKVCRKYAERFATVLVDEFQDTNYAQYRLVRLLASAHGNICVVGDDDQSIYAFRGAKIENILNFQSDYPQVGVYRLEQNYRSTGNILACANSIIAHNTRRMGKNLWTDRPGGQKITVRCEDTENREAEFICDKIMEKQSAGGKWSDNTVLYRTNAQSNAIEQGLRYNSIPYRIVGGTRFFDRAEVKDCMSYLQIISNPSDYLRLSRVYNTPARGIGEKTFKTICNAADAAGISVFSAMRRAKDIDGLTPRSVNAAVKFTDEWMEMVRLSRTLPLDELYEEVLTRSGYREYLEKAAQKDPEYKNKLENVMELKSNILNYMHTAEQPSLQGFLEETGLLTDIDRTDVTADAVTLMTIHSAKGLEFDRVFIAGCEEGLFPSVMSADSKDGVEEERRLAYVAATRARKELYFTCAKQRMLYGRTSFSQPSRFIDELPADCITKKGFREKFKQNYLEERSFDYDFDFALPRKKASAAPAPKSAPKPASAFTSKSAANTGTLTVAVGDRVVHNTFGAGTVISVKGMAGDSLAEIAFDSGETKKMMVGYAGKFMKKV